MPLNKLRQIINARIEGGESQADVAKAMKVHINTVHRAHKAHKERSTANDTPRAGRPISQDHRATKEAVRARVEADSLRGSSRWLRPP